jgi:hypothetical protein
MVAVPTEKGGDAQGRQPPLRVGASLPRLGDDRRDLLDHGLTVRRRRDRSNRRHWRGVRVSLVRAAAASPPRLASSRECLIGELRTSEHPSTSVSEEPRVRCVHGREVGKSGRGSGRICRAADGRCA